MKLGKVFGLPCLGGASKIFKFLPTCGKQINFYDSSV